MAFSIELLAGTQVWASIASWRVFYRLPHPKSSATLLGDTQLFNPRFHNVVSAWLNENGGIVATRFLWLKVIASAFPWVHVPDSSLPSHSAWENSHLPPHGKNSSRFLHPDPHSSKEL